MEIHLEDGDENSVALTRFMVVGKLLANRILNRRGVISVLRGIWPMDVAPCIREISDNMYGISFRSERERTRALEEGPWFVNGSCMLMRKWQQGLNLLKWTSELSLFGFRRNMDKIWADVKYERERVYKFGPHMRATPARSVNWMSALGKENRRMEHNYPVTKQNTLTGENSWVKEDFGVINNRKDVGGSGRPLISDKGKQVVRSDNLLSLKEDDIRSSGVRVLDCGWRNFNRSQEKLVGDHNVTEQIPFSHDLPITVENMIEPIDHDPLPTPTQLSLPMLSDASSPDYDDGDPVPKLPYPDGVIPNDEDDGLSPGEFVPNTPSNTFAPNTFLNLDEIGTSWDTLQTTPIENSSFIPLGSTDNSLSETIQTIVHKTNSDSLFSEPTQNNIPTMPAFLPSRIFIYDKNLKTYVPANNSVLESGGGLPDEEEGIMDLGLRRREFSQHDRITEEVLTSSIRDLKLKRGQEDIEEGGGMVKRRRVEKGIIIRELPLENENNGGVSILNNVAGQKGKRKVVQRKSRRKGIAVWSRKQIDELCLFDVPVSFVSSSGRVAEDISFSQSGNLAEGSGDWPLSVTQQL
ncbi:hypothetical protein CCACVL1_03711 [Corchorus capsularis]|uniref:DUF4283 domain-containing protein n=1 Tax=Corchorus capsularis TaxID=210143 RepID=A0A1R3JXL5_COCAP|nr:hypothetical protein CCACVL1_03711 [Corchorus capsularis]